MASRKSKYPPGGRTSAWDRFDELEPGVGRGAAALDAEPATRSPIAAPIDETMDGFAAAALGMRRSQGRDHLNQLDAFYDRSLITSVEGVIKSGKEASAYRCRAGEALGGGLVVAKVYRARQYRFKNDAVYLEGRERGLRGQVRRAVAKKTSFGRDAGTGLWVSHEWAALHRLYNAGVSVPKPLAFADDAILMQYLGDEDEAAPQLNRVRLSHDEAQRTFDSLLRGIETMLACDVVHGDLSPHNVLYWQGEATIIDLPQAVDPRFNSQARELFLRDVDNVCRYFALQGVTTDAWALANDMWRRYELGEL